MNEIPQYPTRRDVPIQAEGTWPATVHRFDERGAAALRAAEACSRPLLIRGAPGVGKSQTARAAAAFAKRPFLSAVIDGRTEPSDLKWRFDAVGRLADAQVKDDPLKPVEQVSWADVVDNFLPRLNAQVPGLAAALPTEAQWEYACRGDAEPNTPFWFGEQIDSDQVNFDGTEPSPGSKGSKYRRTTVPVKALPCNSWGLYQMHGNVWEWCADWDAPYPTGAVENPAGPSEAPTESAGRVLRGGAWFRRARSCRSAMRNAFDPGDRDHNIGFRLARAAS